MAAESAYSEGLIRLASSDDDGACGALLRSIELFEALTMPFHSARSRLELAAALGALGGVPRMVEDVKDV